MTPKENMLEVINWGKPDYIPLTTEAVAVLGLAAMPLVENPITNAGVDPFGVNWLCTSLGAIPDSRKFLFEDITEWKQHIRFPDIDSIDLSQCAEMERKRYPDYHMRLAELFHRTGIFERLTALMGFENTLIALYSEKEACHELFEAFTDYKIKVANKLIDAYKPDVYINFDDVANFRNTFMSPELYRELIKPYHKKLADAVIDRGIIFGMHVCGRAEALAQDYVDIGVKLWHTTQIMNDIPALQQNFKDRLAFEGGWDSQGRPGCLDATEDELRTELRRSVNGVREKRGFYHITLNF